MVVLASGNHHATGGIRRHGRAIGRRRNVARVDEVVHAHGVVERPRHAVHVLLVVVVVEQHALLTGLAQLGDATGSVGNGGLGRGGPICISILLS